tara:strand:+ start:259 stop:807 length:549 start_codon:yes stop_codon:yes gene_type:complete
MSGHFSRLIYDKCFLDCGTNQSTKPGDYKLYYGQSNSDNSCSTSLGPRNNRNGFSSEINQSETLAARTDLESSLSLRDQKASKCMNGNTLEEKNKKLMGDLKGLASCNSFLNPINSRLDTPMDEYKGLSTLKLQVEFPIVDPVETVFYGHNKTNLVNQEENSRSGKMTRLEAKDEYSKKLRG